MRYLSGITGSLTSINEPPPSFIGNSVGNPSGILFNSLKKIQNMALTTLGYVDSARSGDYGEIVKNTADLMTNEVFNGISILQNAVAYRSSQVTTRLSQLGLGWSHTSDDVLPSERLKAVKEYEKDGQDTEETFLNFMAYHTANIDLNSTTLSKALDAVEKIDKTDTRPAKRRRKGDEDTYSKAQEVTLSGVVTPDELRDILNRVTKIRDTVKKNSEMRKDITSSQSYTNNPNAWVDYTSKYPETLSKESSSIISIDKIINKMAKGADDILSRALHNERTPGSLTPDYLVESKRGLDDLKAQLQKRLDDIDPIYRKNHISGGRKRVDDSRYVRYNPGPVLG